jgi:hypothetical protein
LFIRCKPWKIVENVSEFWTKVQDPGNSVELKNKILELAWEVGANKND